MVGHWFMAKQYFWEDFGNLVAMITHNTCFVALLPGLSPCDTMCVMLFAYSTCLFNLVQWVIVGVRSLQQRHSRAAAA